MRFTAKTDKEIAEERLLPEGIYGFEISMGEDTTSKKGNEMIKLTVRLFKDDGKFILVDDYLLESMMFKLKHACDACGLSDKYQSGELVAADFVGKTGNLKLKIQKDTTGNYPDRNSIADYLVPEDGATFTPPKDALDTVLDKDDLEDEIPF